MLKKIELVSDKKLDNKTMIKIKGGWCCCSSCVCGSGSGNTLWNDDSNVKNPPLPPIG